MQLTIRRIQVRRQKKEVIGDAVWGDCSNCSRSGAFGKGTLVLALHRLGREITRPGGVARIGSKASDQAVIHQAFSDLDGVQGSTFTEIVADHPHVQPIGHGVVFADARDQNVEFADAIDRCGVE